MNGSDKGLIIGTVLGSVDHQDLPFRLIWFTDPFLPNPVSMCCSYVFELLCVCVADFMVTFGASVHCRSRVPVS